MMKSKQFSWFGFPYKKAVKIFCNKESFWQTVDMHYAQLNFVLETKYVANSL